MVVVRGTRGLVVVCGEGGGVVVRQDWARRRGEGDRDRCEEDRGGWRGEFGTPWWRGEDWGRGCGARKAGARGRRATAQGGSEEVSKKGRAWQAGAKFVRRERR